MHDAGTITKIRPPQAWQLTSLRAITIGALLLLTLTLLLVHQPRVPAPWFDEGLNLSTAATLAGSGLYALPDTRGPLVLDPAIQTGPTVLVPVALALRLFGNDVLQGRLVIVAFALIAIVAYWRLAARLVGPWPALLALGLLLAGTPEPRASFVQMSRQVLGEIPALAYLLIGLLIWLKAVEHRSPSLAPLILSGLAWGIAMLTKSQVLITLPAALAAVALLDRCYYRQAGWRAFLVPGLVAGASIGAWYGAQLLLAGPEVFQQNAAVLREGSRLHVLGLNPAHWRNALGTIWSTGYWIWAFPALGWALWRARGRSFACFQHAAVLSVAVVMLAWFVALSIGWGRYLFFPAILAPIWLAGLLCRLGAVGTPRWRILAPAAVTALSALYLLVNGQHLARALVTADDSGYFAMRDYLATRVPPDALIESWEWEHSIAARQPIHHPPIEVTNAYTAYIMSRRTPPGDLYDPFQARPAYILTGPFSTLTGVYGPAIEQCGLVQAAFGAYALVDVRGCEAAGAPDRPRNP